MISIFDIQSAKAYLRQADEFFTGLYVESFPIDNEREPVETIMQRIVNEGPVKSHIWLVTENDRVVAGAVADLYREAETSNLIYLAVSKDHRKKGLAKELINQITLCHPWVKDIVVEVDVPEKENGRLSAIDPATRIRIYERLGFIRVPIRYVQPPLAPGMDYEHGLALMVRTTDVNGIRERMKKYLSDFYESEGLPDDAELKRMKKEMKKWQTN